MTLLGWISILPFFSSQNLSSIRVVRVLRPLRTISSIPGLKVLISSLLASVNLLFNVAGLCAFLFFVFGIIGIQLFSGNMYHRCFVPVDGNNSVFIFPESEENWLCSTKEGRGRMCPIIDDIQSVCCPHVDGILLCEEWSPDLRPNFGFTHFDNILSAFLTIFQCISLEGWADIMYWTQHTTSAWTSLYFVALIVMGSMFMLNLVVAVLYINFSSAKKGDSIAQLDDEFAEIIAQAEAKDREDEHWRETGKIDAVEATRDMLIERYGTDQIVQKGDPNNRKESIFHLGDLNALNEELSPRSLERRKHVICAERYTERALEIIREERIEAAVDYLRRAWEHLHSVDQSTDKPPNQMNVEMTSEDTAERFRPLEDASWTRHVAFNVVQSSKFSNLIVLLIVFNTFFLSIEHYDQPKSLTTFLNTANKLLTGLFTAEMALKLHGLGREGYMADGFNTFDGVIVIISLMEVFVLDDSVGVSALRGFRLLRVFKLARSWKSFNLLLNSMAKTLQAVLSFLVVMLLFLFIYSMLGMQLFGGKFIFEGEEEPMHNFNTLLSAFVTTFQVMTGEDWNEVMYDGIRATSWGAVVYFVSLVVIGTYVVLNLFLAILIDGFIRTQEEQKEKLQKSNPSQLRKMRRQSIEKIQMMEEQLSGKFHDHASYRHNSMFVFGTRNPIRDLAGYIVTNSTFEKIIFILIFISCILLAIDEPGKNDPVFKERIEKIDIVLTACFVAEMLLKLVAFGVVLHQGAYFRDYWNVLDGLIVIVSIMNLFVNANLRAFKALRALRALRPLRVVRRLEGLKVVVNAIIKAFPECVNVAIVAFLFYMIFGILGVNMFGGKFYSCSDDSRNCFPVSESCSEEKACVGWFFNEETGENETRLWQNPRYSDSLASTYHFDNLPNAMLTLFEISTLELWLDVMYTATSTTGVGTAPERDANRMAVMFFLVFIFVSTFFLLNLFVSVVIENFNRIRSEQLGSAFLTPEQKQWVDMQRFLRTVTTVKRNRPPKNPHRRMIFEFVESTKFELAILVCIVLNTAAMSMRYHNDPTYWVSMLELANSVFGFIFLSEVVLKLIGLGAKQYVASWWNVFDSSVVFVNTASSFISYLLINSGRKIDVTILRVFRIARVFRIVKTSKGLRTLFKTLIISLPSLGNVGSLLLLLFFIYAVAGMSLFGGISYGEFVNENANFDSFGNAMLTLFRMSTGEDWNGIMHHCLKPPDCIPTEYSSCYNYVAVVYFVSFIIFGQFIMIQLFIAVILENFEQEFNAENQLVSSSSMEWFSKVWADLNYLRDNPNMMPADRLHELVVLLPPPLGLGNKYRYTRAQLMRVVRVLDVPISLSGDVHHTTTLRALVRRAMGGSLMSDREAYEQGLADESLIKKTGMSEFSAAELYAAIFVQAAFRGYRDRKNLQSKVAKERNLVRKESSRRVHQQLISIFAPAKNNGAGKKTKRLRKSPLVRRYSLGPVSIVDLGTRANIEHCLQESEHEAHSLDRKTLFIQSNDELIDEASIRAKEIMSIITAEALPDSTKNTIERRKSTNDILTSNLSHLNGNITSSHHDGEALYKELSNKEPVLDKIRAFTLASSDSTTSNISRGLGNSNKNQDHTSENREVIRNDLNSVSEGHERYEMQRFQKKCVSFNVDPRPPSSTLKSSESIVSNTEIGASRFCLALQSKIGSETQSLAPLVNWYDSPRTPKRPPVLSPVQYRHVCSDSKQAEYSQMNDPHIQTIEHDTWAEDTHKN